MKILVRDDSAPNPLRAARIKIKYLGSELERVTVRVLHIEALERKTRRIINVIDRDSEEQPDKPVGTPSKRAVNDKDNVKTIAINISLPRVLPNFVLLTKIKKKFGVIPKKVVMAVGLLAVLAALALAIFHHSGSPVVLGNINSSPAGLPKLTKGTPSYPTLLPAGKSILELGGWTRISPSNTSPVYAYVDNIAGNRIDVSEQPLPANFRVNTASQIEQLAESFNTTDKFTLSNTTVYIGTSASGQQSVIFTKDNLLILIKSTTVLSNDMWANYVNSLH
jgi:hypothetical protein